MERYTKETSLEDSPTGQGICAEFGLAGGSALIRSNDDEVAICAQRGSRSVELILHFGGMTLLRESSGEVETVTLLAPGREIEVEVRRCDRSRGVAGGSSLVPTPDLTAARQQVLNLCAKVVPLVRRYG